MVVSVMSGQGSHARRWTAEHSYRGIRSLAKSEPRGGAHMQSEAALNMPDHLGVDVLEQLIGRRDEIWQGPGVFPDKEAMQPRDIRVESLRIMGSLIVE